MSALRVASRRLNLSVQYACKDGALPLRTGIRQCVRAALDATTPTGGQITIRFVDAEEGQALNRDYRHKDYATNVLSFPYEAEPALSGDLVVCVPVVEREANEQAKAADAHYAHLIVHGILHLRGYDHETSAEDAQRMEALERDILAGLGYPDPYAGTI